MDKNEYTLKEISKQYDISIKELRAFINQGKLNALKVGRAYRVKHTDVDRFVKSDTFLKRKKKNGVMPTRNYLCANYDVCLNQAAIRNEMFGCEGCPKFTRARRQQLFPHELAGIVALWESVFGKDVILA